jgi:hypothetical protein
VIFHSKLQNQSGNHSATKQQKLAAELSLFSHLYIGKVYRKNVGCLSYLPWPPWAKQNKYK